MNDDQRQIKMLKRLVKAQDKMILHYRLGKPTMPEWVFNAFDKARGFYNVKNISDIK